MNNKAMHKLSYGLYIVTTKDGEKANGCIVNTAIQAASTPNQLCICINKANYTHDMVLKACSTYRCLVRQHYSLYISALVSNPAGKWTNSQTTQRIKMRRMACPTSQKAQMLIWR